VDKVLQKLSTAAKCMDMAIVWYGQLQMDTTPLSRQPCYSATSSYTVTSSTDYYSVTKFSLCLEPHGQQVSQGSVGIPEGTFAVESWLLNLQVECWSIYTNHYSRQMA